MILETVLLLGISMAWYDKTLPKPLDQSETYRSASGAIGMGAGLPAAMHYYWNKKRPNDDEQIQLKRTLGTHGAALLLSLLLQRGKSRHDQDAAYTNSCIANAACLPIHALYALWRAEVGRKRKVVNGLKKNVSGKLCAGRSARSDEAENQQ